jgi:hypothetical protein
MDPGAGRADGWVGVGAGRGWVWLFAGNRGARGGVLGGGVDQVGRRGVEDVARRILSSCIK